jgi:hypothetical protein
LTPGKNICSRSKGKAKLHHAQFQNGGQITCVLHHVILLCTFSKWRPDHVCSPSCGSIVHIFKMAAISRVFSIMWFYCAHFQNGGQITCVLHHVVLLCTFSKWRLYHVLTRVYSAFGGWNENAIFNLRENAKIRQTNFREISRHFVLRNSKSQEICQWFHLHYAR